MSQVKLAHDFLDLPALCRTHVDFAGDIRSVGVCSQRSLERRHLVCVVVVVLMAGRRVWSLLKLKIWTPQRIVEVSLTAWRDILDYRIPLELRAFSGLPACTGASSASADDDRVCQLIECQFQRSALQIESITPLRIQKEKFHAILVSCAWRQK